MTEIPDDIRAKAALFAEQIVARFDPHCAGLPNPEEFVANRIAAILMAEREVTNERWNASDEAGRASGLMLDPFDVVLAVMAERERCARLCEGVKRAYGKAFAKMIRA